jgi:hypothetical protein
LNQTIEHTCMRHLKPGDKFVLGHKNDVEIYNYDKWKLLYITDDFGTKYHIELLKTGGKTFIRNRQVTVIE